MIRCILTILSFLGWYNGLTAMGFIIFAFWFGLKLIIRSRFEAKFLFFMCVNLMLASLCYLGWVLDFWSVLITGKNLVNTNGWVGIITAMWLPPAICIEVYGFSKYLLPKDYSKYKINYVTLIIFILLAFMFEFFLFFDTKGSLAVEYPANSGEDLVEIHAIYGSPFFILAAFFIISTLFFGFGFLIKSLQSTGLKRKRYFYLFFNETLFFLSGVLDALISTGIFLIFSRFALIITPLMTFYMTNLMAILHK